MPSNTPPAGLDDARTVAPKQMTKKTSARRDQIEGIEDQRTEENPEAEQATDEAVDDTEPAARRDAHQRRRKQPDRERHADREMTGRDQRNSRDHAYCGMSAVLPCEPNEL